jgi:uncharacterized pyridoxal phosphate-containing UPF0001 family protein
MQDQQQILRDNLSQVRDRIADAASRANRDPGDVTLVGVTKYVDASVTRDFVLAGCHDLGESRPQVLWPKHEELSDLEIRWHQIGHLQRNKLRKTQPIVSLIHSVDTIRLLEAIDRLQGLMCMAGLGTTAEAARQDFAQLRTLRDQLAEEYPSFDFNELSMGMSADFEEAIAEGATIVRVGSSLFQGVR